MKFYITALFLGLFYINYSQNILSDSYHPADPKQGASSEGLKLSNAANVDVDYSTGTAYTNIALYTVNTGGIAIPITLNYAATGIKADEEASWVGLGWSLNTGATITREVKGRPDEYFYATGSTSNSGYQAFLQNVGDPYGTLVSCPTTLTIPCGGIAGTYTYFFNKGAGNIMPCGSSTGPTWDIESDLYTLNINGQKIQFVMDSNKNIVLLNKGSAVKITFSNLSFTVLDESGTKYFFSSADADRIKTDTEGTSYYYDNSSTPLTYYNLYWTNYCSAYNMDYCSSTSNFGFGSTNQPRVKWNLTRVETADAKYFVDFTYDSFMDYTNSQSFVYTINKTTLLPYVYQYNDGVLPSDPTATDHGVNLSNVETSIFGKRIKKIVWNQGSVVFDANTLTQDAVTSPLRPSGKKSLDVIKVYDANTVLLKQYTFNHSYFVTPVTTNDNFAYRSKRLQLNSVTEYDKDLTYTLPSYVFEYDNTPLPVRWSFEKDFWGYYKNNNATSMQGTQYYYANYSNTDLSDFALWTQSSIYPLSMPGWGTPLTITGVDRMPNLANTKAAILTKVTMPLQGTYTFDYELNTFCIDNDLTNRNAGGLRIKSITTSDGTDPSKNMVKSFYYDYANTLLPNSSHRSSGEINFMPAYAREANDVYNFVRFNVYKVHSDNYASAVNEGEARVYYREVKVEEVGKGSTVYKYDNAGTFGHNSDVSVNSVYLLKKVKSDIVQMDISLTNPNRNEIQVKRSNYPYCPEPNTDWANGTLKEIDVKDVSGNLIYKKVFNYLIKDYSKINYDYFSNFMLSNEYAPAGPIHRTFVHSPYYYVCVWKVLYNEQEYLYDPAYPNTEAKAVLKNIDYFYDSPYHRYLTSKKSVESNGIELTEKYKYVPDFNISNPGSLNADAPSLAIINLKKTNQLNTVIEKTVLQTKEEADYVLSSKLATYKDLANTNTAGANVPLVRPYQEYSLEITDPLPVSSFNTATVNIASGNAVFAYNTNYAKKTTNELFDVKGNPVQTKIENGPVISKKYGYNKDLPIAEIYNASYNESAFTSFESEEVSDWQATNLLPFNIVNYDKHSGEKCYQLSKPPNSSSISFSLTRDFVTTDLNQSGKYVVSCWVKTNSTYVANTCFLTVHTNNGSALGTVFPPSTAEAYKSTGFPNTGGTWKYVYAIIDFNKIRLANAFQPPPGGPYFGLRTYINNTNPTENILVDDLRIQPYDAFMTSYTYKPLIGQTSKTDARNNSESYEYDSFNRLKLVRDLKGNILKKNVYHYKASCPTCQ